MVMCFCKYKKTCKTSKIVQKMREYEKLPNIKTHRNFKASIAENYWTVL